jgi:hypothetical protein
VYTPRHIACLVIISLETRCLLPSYLLFLKAEGKILEKLHPYSEFSVIFKPSFSLNFQYNTDCITIRKESQ